MKNKSGLPRIAIYVLVPITLLAFGAFSFWFYQGKLTEKLPREVKESPSLSPSQKKYEEGVVVVNFDNGITYKEARDLLSEMNLQIEGANSYWKATNFTPKDSTILTKTDIFTIEVGVGKEDEVINQLIRKPIVRGADKNYFVRITD